MAGTGQAGPRDARLVVVGGGFAGAALIRHLPPTLRRTGEVLLVDSAGEYPFVPLIHEVSVGRLHPDSLLSPIPPLCRGRCIFLQAEAAGVDLDRRKLLTSAGEVGYEYLVLATGSGAARPPDRLSPHFRLFRSLEDALSLRAALAGAWKAATSPGTGHEPGDLTVAIVGGGTTGVELAAEVSALFGYLKRRTARKPAVEPQVVLLEARDRLMGWLEPYFHEVAMESLATLGVEVRLNAAVDGADERSVATGGERLPARTRVWTGGIQVQAPVCTLPGAHDPTGRVKVDDHLTLPDYPEVYVLGDGGVHDDPRLGPLPPTASVAVQQGPWVARDLSRRLRGGRENPKKRPPFRFFDRGYIVSLGPEDAVAVTLGRRLKGAPAQALYRSVLLYYMNRRQRILTTADWAMERTMGRLGFHGGEAPQGGA